MALYNHAAIWEDEPELWPRGYYCNGHVLVDAEKMSKSRGNFLMMNDTIENYSADGTRFACADAGDSLDDANFSRETADKAILSLVNEETWITETLAADGLRSGDDLIFVDKVLLNETNRHIIGAGNSFAAMQFRKGLQDAWYEMLIARDDYRTWCQDSGTPMNRDVVRRWAESIVILICPVCPHW
jgi:leucyl-tRNA synthetase